MHARVGAARALRQYFFSTQPSNGRGERALHRDSVGLYLPAGEFGAVVRKSESEISHAVSGAAGSGVIVLLTKYRRHHQVQRWVGYTIFTYDHF